jgi:transposase
MYAAILYAADSLWAEKLQRVKDRQGVAVVASELGISEQTLRNWVKAEASGKLNGAGAKPVAPEQMELSRLRAENKRLQMELETAKKCAAAYFAKDLL